MQEKETKTSFSLQEKEPRPYRKRNWEAVFSCCLPHLDLAGGLVGIFKSLDCLLGGFLGHRLPFVCRRRLPAHAFNIGKPVGVGFAKRPASGFVSYNLQQT